MNDIATTTTPDVRPPSVEVKQAREHLQATLDAIVAQTRADMSKEWEQWNEAGWFMRYLLLKANTAQGFAYGVGQWFAGLWDMVEGLGQLLTEPFDTVDQMLAELGDLASDAKELFILIYQDKPSREMLIQFASDWWSAIPPDEQRQLAAQFGTQFLLDFAAGALLAFVTAGAGAIAIVAKWVNRIRLLGGRAADILEQLDEAFQLLGEALRKKELGQADYRQAQVMHLEAKTSNAAHSKSASSGSEGSAPAKAVAASSDSGGPAPKGAGSGGSAKKNVLQTIHRPFEQGGPARTKVEFESRYGEKFSSQAEADTAWKVYQQTAYSREEIVIGRLPDTEAGTELGLRRLNEPNWLPTINDAWIQGGIDSRRQFIWARTLQSRICARETPNIPRPYFFEN